MVESCVNRVGVELNTASASLLSYVAGIGEGLAKKIVEHREKYGAFADRWAILQVGGLGPKTFEQAGGFLRLHTSAHPLDRSAVHPERYGLVEKMAEDLGVGVGELVGRAELVDRIDIKRYIDDSVGEPTLRDIIAELKKPGRDPRAEFEAPRFREDVNTLEDLAENMELEGVVTNVTAFGAFVDVGVHQDGLVHISELADHFVKDPREVVKVGDKMRVRVLSVDLVRRRISMSAKRGEPRTGVAAPKGDAGEGRTQGKGRGPDRGREKGKGGGAQRGGSKGSGKGGRSGFSNNPFASLLDKK